MGIAQVLYQAGVITYMRTDSVNLSSKAIEGIRELVKTNMELNIFQRNLIITKLEVKMHRKHTKP